MLVLGDVHKGKKEAEVGEMGAQGRSQAALQPSLPKSAQVALVTPLESLQNARELL